MPKDFKKKSAPPATRIADKRFASFETDPRFRLPSKKHGKTTLDKRFSRMLDDNDFTATAKVDRYGRKIKSDSKKKALQRLYDVEDDEGAKKETDDEDEDEDEIDPDEEVQKELRAAHEKFDPARGGGFSSSEEDSESSEDDSDEEDGGVEVTAGDLQKLQDEHAEVETGEVTNRIAIVNLDWDHIKSNDLMALFSSFLPAEDGSVDKIAVYPSEFGKERMQREEVEGPPKALFKKKDDDDSSESEVDSDEEIKKELLQEGNDEDFDSDALRSYQLDRLRYYYAVMTCSTPEAAKKIYEATDGTEYQSSSNFLDLRFVPDDVTFDDEPRDECDELPESYKPVEFVTNALQSSKVKLTWDMHPEEVSRKDAAARAFTGSRNDIDENDLKTYLASDSEGSDEEEEVVGEEDEDAPKLSKKELARKKMREALGLTDEPAAKTKKGPVGDMEITFTPALSGNAKPKKAEGDNETTIEKYQRKERERKESKRQRAKAKRDGEDESGDDEDDEEAVVGDADSGEDLGFDDPFFTTAAKDTPAPSKSALRKEERLKKRQARDEADATSAAEKAKLQSIMAADTNDSSAAHLDHFDMADIMRSEKQKSKKGKKSKQKAAEIEANGKLQDGFEMDVEDDRFKAVFESHEFAIDPSNPKFKGTEGMKKLLEEGRRKRGRGDGEGEDRRSKKSKKGRR